eukprot:gene9166-biopygen22693
MPKAPGKNWVSLVCGKHHSLPTFAFFRRPLVKEGPESPATLHMLNVLVPHVFTCDEQFAGRHVGCAMYGLQGQGDSQQVRALLGEPDSGAGVARAGVARATGHFLAWVARAWRGHGRERGAGLSCDPWGNRTCPRHARAM